jgi:hypothetical protein
LLLGKYTLNSLRGNLRKRKKKTFKFVIK